jgi:hypothetical protein
VEIVQASADKCELAHTALPQLNRQRLPALLRRGRAPDPPHKRPSLELGSLVSVGFVFHRISTGRGMCLLLVLSWRSVVAGDIRGDNSRFGELNSRLGRYQFPFSLLRELVRKGLIRLTVSSAGRRVSGKIGENSRFFGKNWEFVPLSELATALGCPRQ